MVERDTVLKTRRFHLMPHLPVPNHQQPRHHPSPVQHQLRDVPFHWRKDAHFLALAGDRADMSWREREVGKGATDGSTLSSGSGGMDLSWT
ncbi:hypothetical protein OCU04_003120 [Sclerotinia nivalis]|uniref:Uncharacterized protein n=1 Tax=Sclerotinia nivalis TaxID=352851 RepID=A0A9X0DMV7_9HELO|nr:hypothetical protein OCU04_003120 [Sclerotinia nivalis]